MGKWVTIKELKEARAVLDFSPLEYKPFIKATPYVSFFFANFFPFTPNQISILWGFIAILSFIIMAFGSYGGLLAGILIYQFALLLDFIDGDIARATKKTSLVGTYLDKFFHSTHRGLIILALGIGLYNTYGNVHYFYLGIWTCTFFLIDNLSKVKVYEMFLIEGKTKVLGGKKGEGKKGYEGNLIKKIKFYVPRLLSPNQPLSILVFVILFNVSQYYLILMAIIAPLFFIKSFIQIYKKLGKMAS